MKAKEILNSDISDMMISSLPTRPTAPRHLGGKGYGAAEMKEAFDKLPLYIIEKYNELVGDVQRYGDDSLAAAIPSGIKNGHTLHSLFEDVQTGELATYFSFFGKSLLAHMITIYGEIDELKSKLRAMEKSKEETV